MDIPTRALCVDNSDYPVSLEMGKAYPFLGFEAVTGGALLVRVVDESGEDYLYPAGRFQLT